MNTDIFGKIANILAVNPDIICKDGIKFRNGNGPMFEKTGFWENHARDEEIIWSQSKYRPLELTKDLNDNCVWDIRCETGLKPHTSKRIIGNMFYRNLMSWRFLIDNALIYGRITDYENLDNSTIIDNFNLNPVARINCKKTLGGGSCKDAILKHHIEMYGDLIRKQIVNIHPNVVYIGGFTGNIILDNILRPIMPDLVLAEPGEWIYYSPGQHVVVINGYHPSYWINIEKIYNNLKGALENFLKTDYYSDFQATNELLCMS